MSYFACLLSVVSFFVVFVSDNFDVTFISDVFLWRDFTRDLQCSKVTLLQMPLVI